MILIVKRQMTNLEAYVPIAPITQGHKRKILFRRKESRRGDKKPDNPMDL